MQSSSIIHPHSNIFKYIFQGAGNMVWGFFVSRNIPLPCHDIVVLMHFMLRRLICYNGVIFLSIQWVRKCKTFLCTVIGNNKILVLFIHVINWCIFHNFCCKTYVYHIMLSAILIRCMIVHWVWCFSKAFMKTFSISPWRLVILKACNCSHMPRT